MWTGLFGLRLIFMVWGFKLCGNSLVVEDPLLFQNDSTLVHKARSIKKGFYKFGVNNLNGLHRALTPNLWSQAVSPSISGKQANFIHIALFKTDVT